VPHSLKEEFRLLYSPCTVIVYGPLCGYLKNGRVLYGGQTDEKSRYIAPTLMDNIDIDSAIMKDEIFGPILPIIPFKTIDEVLEQIKKNPYPLGDLCVYQE